MSDEPRFESIARSSRSGLLSDLWLFLRQTRKWWLVPVLLVLALLGMLIVLSGTGAAPFIYTLF